MSYLVRKITRGKWLSDKTKDNPFDISSDAITADLRSRGNTLSVWEVEQEADIKEAVIALATAGDRLDTIDVVWIPKNELQEKQIECIDTPGNTPIKTLQNTHIDLSSMNYFKIGLFAESIINNIAAKRIKRYSAGDLKKLFKAAIQDGTLSKADLSEKIQETLEPKLNK